MLDILDCVQYNFVKAQAKMIVTDKEVCVMNTITHDFVIAPGAGIKKKNVIYVIIPPLLYAIYAGIGYCYLVIAEKIEKNNSSNK